MVHFHFSAFRNVRDCQKCLSSLAPSSYTYCLRLWSSLFAAAPTNKKKKATRATPNSLKHNSKAKGNESMLAHVKMHLGNSSNPSVSNSEPPSLSQRGDPFASSSSVNLDTELGLRERPLVGDVPREKKNLDPTVGRRTTAGPSALEKEKKSREKNDATECELLDTKKSDNEKKDDSTMDEIGLAVDIEVGSTASTHSSAHPRTMALDHDVVELGDGNASGAIETPKKILRDAFVTPSKPPAPLAARPAELESEPESCFRAPAPRLPTSPVHVVFNPVFRPHGTLPTGFPEARDLSKDVQAGKFPVRGQSRFSRVPPLLHTMIPRLCRLPAFWRP